jgi:hypothetical protein
VNPPTATSGATPQARRRVSRSTLILGIAVVLLAAGLGFALWQNYKLQQPGTREQIVAAENERLADEVAEMILVPDESPTIANIVDVEALKKNNADFYKDAVNGDRLLIYSTKAIIFREPESKIINVSPVKITGTEEGVEPTGESSDQPTE